MAAGCIEGTRNTQFGTGLPGTLFDYSTRITNLRVPFPPWASLEMVEKASGVAGSHIWAP